MKYYYLKEGETIKDGDEVEVSSNYNDPVRWVKGNPKNIGSKAPNPNFISHRRYRRLIVSSSLNDLTVSEKYKYLFNKIYENVTHSRTGKLLINTYYCRKAAELLGGNYDELSKIGKDLFKADIVDERLYVEAGFDKYLSY